MSHQRGSIPLLLLLFVMIGTAAIAAEPAYVRQPDLYGDRIVFCAESDIWIARSNGDDPRRITTHAGLEYAPAFSPDGRTIAFSGLYDGNMDVYVISADGGEPRRVTWHPGADEVVGWTPNGKSVLFRSRRADPNGYHHLFSVDLKGGDPQELPLGWASRIDIDKNSDQWAFVRNNRENRNWKRYRGGWNADIWVGDPDEADFKQVSNFSGADHFPMWYDGRIYFMSDKGGTANLWSMQPDGEDRRQLTDYKKWDIRWPMMADDGRIIFTKAADIYIYDIERDKTRKVDLKLSSDLLLTRVRYPNAGRSLTEFDITPKGDRVTVVARGEIFSVPTEEGVTIPVTRGTGAREKLVDYDPKGERILYITDEPGEEELRSIDAWGRGEPEVIKKGVAGVWHYRPKYSPDGKYIAYGDESYGLFIMPVEGGDSVEVDRGTEGELRRYYWSPDGRWLGYIKTQPNRFGMVMIYDTVEKTHHEITGPYTSDYAMTWDPDGRYLYFASDRQINPLIDELDFNNVEMLNDKLYMVLLREDVDNPFLKLAGLPPEDEKDDEAEAEEDEEAEAEEEVDEDAPDPVEIDFDGIQTRVIELPVPKGRYFNLEASSSHLFYVSIPPRGLVDAGDFFTPGDNSNKLMAFSLSDKEASVFAENVGGYEMANEGGKIALRSNGTLYVVSSAAPPGPGLAKGKVDLSQMVIELNPREEWAQIYYESWRQMREFYWDEEMSGVDWDAIRDQYAELLPRLSSRADLTDLVGQIFGEMNTSHTYVFGGDPGVRVGRVGTGLLGADLVRDGDNAYQVTKIYRGADPDRVQSPLDVPGVDIAEGDFIRKVNGLPIEAGRSFHAYMQNLVGKDVVLTVSDEADGDETREVVVSPMRTDNDLRYADWVRRNREYVLEQTDGKMGYIHIPDMLNPGLIEFNTWFYPQLDKEGMVVDVRWNGGGSYSEMILERFRRKPLSFGYRRGGAYGPYPDHVVNGPFVVLVNEGSASDGDIFPQAVQMEGLAPIIGVRTWGGVNGITDIRPLVDGGLVTQSQVAWWDPKDGWGLENRGVIPDIEVEALPQDVAAGVDRQLMRGIEEVLRLHKENPPLKPVFPKSMQRARKAYRDELNH
jgi:tricorn protease